MPHKAISLVKGGALALAFALAGALSPALAADGGGGGGGAADGIVCKAGFVYNAAKQICEKPSALNDEQLYEQGRVLALAGHYDNALDALQAVRNKNDAMVLTMIGYSKRKQGHLDEGIAYYHQALAIEPDNLNTHEYLGEGYLSAGRIDLAEAELDTLQALCGTECKQYQDLARAIAGDGKWN